MQRSLSSPDNNASATAPAVVRRRTNNGQSLTCSQPVATRLQKSEVLTLCSVAQSAQYHETLQTGSCGIATRCCNISANCTSHRRDHQIVVASSPPAAIRHTNPFLQPLHPHLGVHIPTLVVNASWSVSTTTRPFRHQSTPTCADTTTASANTALGSTGAATFTTTSTQILRIRLRAGRRKWIRSFSVSLDSDVEVGNVIDLIYVESWIGQTTLCTMTRWRCMTAERYHPRPVTAQYNGQAVYNGVGWRPTISKHR